jgi:hypothetical protein
LATKKRQKQLRKQKKQKKLREVKAPLVLMPQNPMTDIPEVNYDGWLRAIESRDPRCWDAILHYLTYFERHSYKAYGPRAIKSIHRFCQLVYTLMGVDEFSPSGRQASQLVQCGHIFQHLVAVTGFKNNDGALHSAILQQKNLPKVLFLLNPRCDLQINQSDLFNTDPTLVSLWYNNYLLGISSPTDQIQRNLYNHLQVMDERWRPPHHALTGIYFTSTYHNTDAVRRVKKIINKGVKEKGVPEFTNNPNPKSVAIVTNKWHRNHAVYKSASPLVEQLVGEYNLTLVWTANPQAMPDTIVTDYFDKVVNCYFTPRGELIIPDEVKNNDFQFVYFPDIGMTDESIWLSNCRMAPIQAVGYGHPDTTGDGNEIDYFVGGQVEKEATDKYAETMVLLPGLAQEPAWPTAERKYNYKDDSIVRVNCVWGPDKYNYTLLRVLSEINKEVNRKLEEKSLLQQQEGNLAGFAQPVQSNHEFHFFASPGINRYAALPPFIRDVANILPNVVLHSEQEYYDYMENAEMHDFSLNSFPFGCYNVLIESLYMGLPFITMYGDRFYNRAGMRLNEQVGLEENNYPTARGFIQGAAELILDPEKLKRQRQHLADIDLKDRLFTLKGKHFLEAVNYMIANHPFEETKLIGETE